MHECTLHDISLLFDDVVDYDRYLRMHETTVNTSLQTTLTGPQLNGAPNNSAPINFQLLLVFCFWVCFVLGGGDVDTATPSAVLNAGGGAHTTISPPLEYVALCKSKLC